MMGVVFGGIAIGPAIGSFTIQISNNPIMPFYAAFVVHSIQTLISMFIMPESLSKEKQYNARRVHAEKKEQNAEAVREAKWTAEREGYGFLKRVGIALKAWCRPVVNVFAPLALLGPTKKADGSQDWSLPVLCLTTGFYSMMMVSVVSSTLSYLQALYEINVLFAVHVFRQNAICTAQIRLVQHSTWQFPLANGRNSYRSISSSNTSVHQAHSKTS
jgi:hypothetical protein